MVIATRSRSSQREKNTSNRSRRSNKSKTRRSRQNSADQKQDLLSEIKSLLIELKSYVNKNFSFSSPYKKWLIPKIDSIIVSTKDLVINKNRTRVNNPINKDVFVDIERSLRQLQDYLNDDFPSVYSNHVEGLNSNINIIKNKITELKNL